MSGEALRGKTLIQIASKKGRCHHLKQMVDLGFVVVVVVVVVFVVVVVVVVVVDPETGFLLLSLL